MQTPTEIIAGVPAFRIAALAAREAKRFAAARPKTRKALKTGSAAFLNDVPMHWMRDWPLPFPVVVDAASGARVTDIDGHVLDDFCLGDTGAMFGHSPPPVARALRNQARRGLTTMLPTLDAFAVGALLTERFGPFRWQIATTATDANRFALRIARAVTGRAKVLVFNGCYHGTVDETMVRLVRDATVPRPGLVGQVADLTATAVACEFNDLAAVEAALATGEIAAILTEPALTNCAMVLPAPGFLDGLRRLATASGTLLMIDETHTICAGPGGYAREHGIVPDIFVLGKPVAGGIPASVWGLSDAVATRFAAYDAARPAGHSGMGTTLSANPLQLAAMRATLADVMTPDNYARMDAGAARLAAGLTRTIRRHRAPWHVVRLGARVEFICAPGPLLNGAEAETAARPVLEAAIHAALVNRGILIAPFHNMMLVSPVTTKKQIDRLIDAFHAICDELFAKSDLSRN